ncbi:MAG: helix-turn-helix domain-containing protein [Eubacteriales bacterium]|nr:helix-turn-helix domain-containing protein [Eubacteriales bacterium]
MKRHKTSKLFFFSFLAVAVIPIIFFVYSYFLIENIVYDEIQDKNISSLQATSKMVDAYLQECDAFFNTLQLQTEISSMSLVENPKNQKSSVTAINSFKKSLSAYSFRSPLFDQLYFYFNRSDIIVCAEDVFTDSSFFYENFFHIEGMDYEEWKSMLKEASYVRSYMPIIVGTGTANEDTSTERNVVCIRNIFPYKSDTNGASSMMLIREETLLDLLMPADETPGVYTAILDSDASLLAASDWTFDLPISQLSETSNTLTSNGQNMFAFTVESSYNSWKYIIMIPQSDVLRKVSDLRTIYIAASILALLMGIGFSIFFSFRYSRPINASLDQMKEHLGEPVNLYSLPTNTQQLIMEERNKYNQLQNQLPYLRRDYINTLLQGIGQMDAAHEIGKQLGIDFSYPWFCVMIFSIEATEDVNLYQIEQDKSAIECAILRVMPEALLYESSLNQLELIQNLPDNDPAQYDRLDALIREILLEITEETDAIIQVSCGNIAEGTEEICRSRKQAQEAMRYGALDPSQSYIRYHEFKTGQGVSLISREKGNALIGLLLQGDTEEALRWISELWEKTLAQPNISLDIIRLLLNNLSNLLFEAARRIPAEADPNHTLCDEIITIDKLPTTSRRYQAILSYTEKICVQLNEQRQKSAITLSQKIAAYLQENYTNPSMSLKMTADAFSLSEPYLSQFFSKQMGIHFSVYIEDLRLNRAKEYLQDTGKTINEIAELVGYNSSSVFRNAFKRRFGVSPVQYRNDQRKE